jgi:hypothetical protein
VLAASSPAWAGSAFRATGTGMPLYALIATVTGFAPAALPLSVVLPLGQPGCYLVTTPDALDLPTGNAATATSQHGLPNDPAIAGIVFYHQMIPFEIDLSINILAITATNALEVTVGFL